MALRDEKNIQQGISNVHRGAGDGGRPQTLGGPDSSPAASCTLRYSDRINRMDRIRDAECSIHFVLKILLSCQHQSEHRSFPPCLQCGGRS